MRYTYDFIVPTNATEKDPYYENVRLDIGVLQQVIIRFRNGCHYRVAVSVLDGLFQIVPATEGYGVYGNDNIFNIPMDYPLTRIPYELILKGWTNSTVFPHTVTFWFDVQQPTIDTINPVLQNLLYGSV